MSLYFRIPLGRAMIYPATLITQSINFSTITGDASFARDTQRTIIMTTVPVHPNKRLYKRGIMQNSFICITAAEI